MEVVRHGSAGGAAWVASGFYLGQPSYGLLVFSQILTLNPSLLRHRRRQGLFTVLELAHRRATCCSVVYHPRWRPSGYFMGGQ